MPEDPKLVLLSRAEAQEGSKPPPIDYSTTEEPFRKSVLEGN
jgi:hypothetical protein